MKFALLLFSITILGTPALSQQQNISNIQSTSLPDSLRTINDSSNINDSSGSIIWPKVTYSSGFWKNRYYVDGIESNVNVAEKYISQCQASKGTLANAKGLFILARILLIAGNTAILITTMSNINTNPMSSTKKPNYTGTYIGIGFDLLSLIPLITALNNYHKAFEEYRNNCGK